MKISDLKPLDQLRTWCADQSWHAVRHYRAGAHRLRFNLRRNAHNHQSFCRLETLDPAGTGWHPLAELPAVEGPQGMESLRLSYVQKALTGADLCAIEGDAARLLTIAAPLLD